MISLESKEENFISDARSDWKPVKFLHNRGIVRSTIHCFYTTPV